MTRQEQQLLAEMLLLSSIDFYVACEDVADACEAVTLLQDEPSQDLAQRAIERARR